jgi:CRISPR/Cas system CSM-associated protein Csm2 small subunit
MEVAKGKLAKILPIIYYAKERKLVNDLFLNFVKLSLKTLNDINNEDDFKKSLWAFREVFQAVIAYSNGKK